MNSLGTPSAKQVPPAAKDGTQPVQIMVLGMHRSGTSALTGALARMGIYVGDEEELTSKSWENPQGFYERKDARNICDALLHGADADWWKVSSFEPDNIGADVVNSQRKSIRSLVSHLDERGSQGWALKEPRLCLLAPIFRGALSHPFSIIVIRHPVEVARSLRRRNGFSLQTGLALWEVYTINALRHGRKTEHALVSYHELTREPEKVLSDLAEKLKASSASLPELDLESAAESVQEKLHREHAEESDLQRLSAAQLELWNSLSKGDFTGQTPGLSSFAASVLREFEVDQQARNRIEEERKDLSNQARKFKAKVQESKDVAAQHAAKRKAAEDELAESSAERKKMADDISALKKEIESLRKLKDGIETRLESTHQELTKANAELGELSYEKESMVQRLQTECEQNRELSAEVKRLNSGISEERAAREEAQKRFDGESAKNNKLHEKLERQDAALKDLELQRDELAQKLEEEHQVIESIAHDKVSVARKVRGELKEVTGEIQGLRKSFGAVERLHEEVALLRMSLEEEKNRHEDYARDQKRERAADRFRQQAATRRKRLLQDLDITLLRLAGARGLVKVLLRPISVPRMRGYILRAQKIALSPIFDAEWYLEQNPDVRDTGVNPLLHYIANGGREGRAPSVLFDPNWYLDHCCEELGADITPLEHYLATSVTSRTSPHRLFDPNWYLERNPDVRRAGDDPLEHFIEYGGSEGRAPHPEFDSAWYLREYSHVLESGANLLLNYLQHGKGEGRLPPEQNDLNRNFGISPGSGKPLAIDSANAGGHPVTAQAPVSQNPGPKLPMTALVISWDIGHNPLGRAYMLADVLDRVVHNVILAGFQFPRYGDKVWEPLQDSRIPVIRIPGKTFPEFLEIAEHIAATVKPDIVFACKPRLPSLQLGLRVRELAGCPLILDNDDHELSFFKDQTPFDLEALEALKPGSLADQTEPYEQIWTRLAESLIGEADAQLVSNTALQNKFGGVLAPHVRDEKRFIQKTESGRAEVRERFGISADAKVVMFFGTPRMHKGVKEIAEAVGRIADPNFKFVIVGAAPDRSVTVELGRLASGRVIQLPNQDFEAIPEILSIADVVALPQDVEHPIARYQLPAKAIDAIAAGKPLLVSRTPPLMDLVRDGVARVFNSHRLPQELERAVADQIVSRTTRGIFEQKYSYAALACTLRSVIAELTGNSQRMGKTSSSSPGERLIAAQSRVFGIAPAVPESDSQPGTDFVVLWKQNDTTLYGRRHDMVIKYLASRPDVRRVIVFDAPISMHQLRQYRKKQFDLTHDRHLYLRTQEKALGLRDSGKIQYRAFIFPPAQYDIGAGRYDEHPELQDAFIGFISQCLESSRVDARQAVFWLYPKGEFLPAIVDYFKPANTVVDIVDDHRAWPDVSDMEKCFLETQYRQVLQSADQVICNCEPVRQSMMEYASEIKVIPNGCDTEPPVKKSSENPVFEKMCAWPGRIIGFIGNLEPKIDIELLERISREFPNDLLVLLGSTHANAEIRTLSERKNVLMPGVIPYDECGGWLELFSVGIIPHRRIGMTEYMNPLKAYVYLAHGVPVVATNVPNTLDESPFFSVSKSHEEFIAALREKPDSNARDTGIDDFVRENSWERRFGRMVDGLIGACRARGDQSNPLQRNEP